MPVRETPQGPVWRLHTRIGALLIWMGWFAGVALTVWCWQLMTETTIWAFVYDAPRQASDIGGRMIPPRIDYLPELWKPLWDTINIATLGTLIGVGIATPVAFLAARNTSPSPLVLRPVALLIIVASRSINSLIWALLLVSIVGPGILSGVVAIALRSIGFVGKLLYEAIEETDRAQVEAVEAAGASGPQILVYGIWPQVAPSFWAISVFRWDINIRESTVLGLVGAGGIGLQLQNSLNTLAWPQVTMILILILTTVLASEWVSARVRRTII
ncbi:MAG: phosphonate ABC transporter, permease protein PhnE [Gammaproteobacteria bacterium]|nr:phosphonate ABC transporter, permease protein PhnE [Gammaproteobacteria bacterium]